MLLEGFILIWGPGDLYLCPDSLSTSSWKLSPPLSPLLGGVKSPTSPGLLINNNNCSDSNSSNRAPYFFFVCLFFEY